MPQIKKLISLVVNFIILRQEIMIVLLVWRGRIDLLRIISLFCFWKRKDLPLHNRPERIKKLEKVVVAKMY